MRATRVKNVLPPLYFTADGHYIRVEMSDSPASCASRKSSPAGTHIDGKMREQRRRATKSEMTSITSMVTKTGNAGLDSCGEARRWAPRATTKLGATAKGGRRAASKSNPSSGCRRRLKRVPVRGRLDCLDRHSAR